MAFQSILLPSVYHSTSTGAGGWDFGSSGQLIIPELSPNDTRYLTNFRVRHSNQPSRLRLVFERTLLGNQTGQDLTDQFELNGAIRVTIGNEKWTFQLAGADLTEPYNWTPSNGADIDELYNAVGPDGSFTSGVIELSDDGDFGDIVDSVIEKATTTQATEFTIIDPDLDYLVIHLADKDVKLYEALTRKKIIKIER